MIAAFTLESELELDEFERLHAPSANVATAASPRPTISCSWKMNPPKKTYKQRLLLKSIKPIGLMNTLKIDLG